MEEVTSPSGFEPIIFKGRFRRNTANSVTRPCPDPLSRMPGQVTAVSVATEGYMHGK
jgi:hypothetical protein